MVERERTLAQAAEAAGVSARCARKWALGEDGFAAAWAAGQLLTVTPAALATATAGTSPARRPTTNSLRASSMFCT